MTTTENKKALIAYHGTVTDVNGDSQYIGAAYAIENSEDLEVHVGKKIYRFRKAKPKSSSKEESA